MVQEQFKFEHWCEVCGKTEMLTPDEAFNQGWDFPPNFGRWGYISPRTCGDCSMFDTVWWALNQNGKRYDLLTEQQIAICDRITAETPLMETRHDSNPDSNPN